MIHTEKKVYIYTLGQYPLRYSCCTRDIGTYLTSRSQSRTSGGNFVPLFKLTKTDLLKEAHLGKKNTA